MKLNIIGTGSHGNCYCLTSGTGEKLIIEAGVNFREVKRQLNYDLTNISGCIITHEHGDHAKHVDQMTMAGINVHSSFGTMAALENDFINPIIAGKTHHIGSFMVVGFPVEHDAREPFGFMIYHIELGWLLFITDTSQLHRKLSGFNHIMIETNYSLEILQHNYDMEEINGYLATRIPRNHLSLENVLSILKQSNLDELKTLVFIHLSQKFNAEIFEKTAMEKIGIKPIIAHNEMIINI